MPRERLRGCSDRWAAGAVRRGRSWPSPGASLVHGTAWARPELADRPRSPPTGALTACASSAHTYSPRADMRRAGLEAHHVATRAECVWRTGHRLHGQSLSAAGFGERIAGERLD